VVIKHVSL